MASPSPRYDNRHDSKQDTAIPLGLWATVHFREAVGDLLSAEGYVQYCSTYGVRLKMSDGRVVYTPHTNIIGATGYES